MLVCCMHELHRELEYVLKDSQASAVLADSAFSSTIKPLAEQIDTPLRIIEGSCIEGVGSVLDWEEPVSKCLHCQTTTCTSRPEVMLDCVQCFKGRSSQFGNELLAGSCLSLAPLLKSPLLKFL